MIAIEEMEAMLDEMTAEFPPELFKSLNGGILLLPEAKQHPKSKGNDLYIMGEYHRNASLGRYIVIYYGSFVQVHRHLTRPQLKEQLLKTLKHEFTHHLESLAGERDLEEKDERDIAAYMDKKEKENQ